MSALASHPLADLFPLLEGRCFDDLVEDIRQHGVLEPITTLEGKVLDGRNRYRAACKAGRDCEQREFSGIDPLAFVISQNLKRRQLNELQRAMAAARLANLQWGQRRDRVEGSIDLSTASRLLNVSETSAKRAKAVQSEGAPELVAAVDRAHLAVSAAAQATRLPPKEQREIAEQAASGKTNVVAKVLKQKRRNTREAELAQAQRALPNGKFGVILADPEWQFEVRSENGLDRSASNHYPTSPLSVIAARDVPSIAHDDCVLFLWATIPMLPQALQVMTSWGFKYVSQVVWVKDHKGTGYWFRARHELLLVGTKGNVPCPAQGTQRDSVIERPRGKHSAKPEAFHELIEDYFPNMPKVELNRRGPPREGWAAWGNEAIETIEVEPAQKRQAPSTSAASGDADELDIPEFLRRAP